MIWNDTQKEIGREIYNHLGWDNYELAVYEDGTTEVNESSWVTYHQDPILTVDLSEQYWRETLAEWGYEDLRSINEDEMDFVVCNIILPGILG